MFTGFFCAHLIAALFSSASASTDRTEAVLADFQGKGLELLRADNLPGGTTLKLFLTSGARAIIKDSKFEKPDPRFDLSEFGTYVVDTFSDSLAYFSTIVVRPATEPLVRELAVIIEDMGAESEGTISAAKTNSRVITLDLKRWDKLKLGYRGKLANLTSIHEFTHVVNYKLDSAETQKHRELTAIVFECLNWVHKWGTESFRTIYLKQVTSGASGKVDASKVAGEAYHGNETLRFLAHAFILNTMDGVYGVKGDRLRALEEFADAYLEDKATGAAGFDDALKRVGLTDRTGAVLTLERIQADLIQAFE